MHGSAQRCGLVVDGRWHLLVDEPAEDVTDAALTGLVRPQPGNDSAIDHPADPRDVAQVGAVHDVTGGRAHDRHELSRADRTTGGRGDVGVDVAHAHGDAGRQTEPVGHLGGEATGAGTECSDRLVDLLGDEVFEVGIQRGEVGGGRIGVVLPGRLEPGGARVAQVGAAELPDDPVGGLHPAIHPGVDLRILLE